MQGLRPMLGLPLQLLLLLPLFPSTSNACLPLAPSSALLFSPISVSYNASFTLLQSSLCPPCVPLPISLSLFLSLTFLPSPPSLSIYQLCPFLSSFSMLPPLYQFLPCFLSTQLPPLPSVPVMTLLSLCRCLLPSPICNCCLASSTHWVNGVRKIRTKWRPKGSCQVGSFPWENGDRVFTGSGKNLN